MRGCVGFDYPEEIRRAVYTTNVVESPHMGLRKVIKSRASFLSEEAALIAFFDATEAGHSVPGSDGVTEPGTE